MKLSFKPVRVISIVSNYSCSIITLLLFLVFPVESEASTNNQPKQNNWFVSGSTGVVMRSREISEGLIYTADGFRHKPGFAFDLTFGKTIENRWEPAIRWGAYTLFGQSDLPHYSSVGYYAAYPGLLEQEPLEYVTQGNSVSFILRLLLFKNIANRNYAVNIHPFVEAGIGVNNFTTHLRYREIPATESSSLIYRDRNGENKNGTGQIVTGLGLKIGEQGKWNAVILMNADWTNFSRLNAVHHLSNNRINSSRAIVSRITAGITLPIRRRVRTDNHLPFRW